MEIILLQEVDKLGGPGQVVRVANGYGRNYLIPKKLAVPATSGNLKMFEQKRAKLLRLDAKNKGDAEKLAAMLGELTAVIKRKAGEKETLFGSVTSLDLVDWLTSQNFEIDRKRIDLREPIKALGEHSVPIRLHREVIASLKVRVEAENQPEKKSEAKTEEKPETKKED
ncbi:MAG: 50S ribosomal protein L9 [Acidobacteria bacterium]|nr:50S ribosomal protein L9 [Acidobacteriota bacterium]